MTPYTRKRLDDPAAVEALSTLRRLAAAEPAATDPIVRRARTIVFVLEGESLVAFDYLTNEAIDCSELGYRLLRRSEDWRTASELLSDEPDREAASRELAAMLEVGLLLAAGTELARDDERFEEAWEWDVRAGLFHLAIKDPLMMSREAVIEDLEERARARPLVPLFTTNHELAVVHRPGRPSLDRHVLPFLAKRRTWRDYRPVPVPADALTEGLFAGLAITSFLEEPIAGMGRLPLKMTPSGGARNPYEAYVFARDVEGLAPGVYHYSATEHSLGLVRAAPMPWGQELLGGQEWTDGAGAIVLLVASFARTMWKYPHPMAYRAVLIEAGHIGQNIMLAAAQHGVSAGPTAALCDTVIEEVLSLDRVTQAATYALVLGVPDWDRRDHLTSG
jgi:SagB-type dehydrogenase family enzyme